jgi:uncharacterized membrane protein
MADTRLTKISFCRKIYLCLLAVTFTEKFIKEEEADNKKRNNFPQPLPDREPRIFIIRHAFWYSLFLILIFGCIGYVIGFLCNALISRVSAVIIKSLQIFGALLLLWGTLFVRGWEIQTFCGVTLTERVNAWLYRSMYCLGTAIIVLSIKIS